MNPAKELSKIISPLRFRMIAAWLEQAKSDIVGSNGGNLPKDLRDFASLLEELTKHKTYEAWLTYRRNISNS